MFFILYLLSYFISLFILYILLNDLKEYNIKIYNNIDHSTKIKLYTLISIGFIHYIWVLIAYFTDYDNDLVYGLPIYLLLPYLLILYSFFSKKNEEDETPASKNIAKFINRVLGLYFFLIIIFIIIPVSTKKNIFQLTKSQFKKITGI